MADRAVTRTGGPVPVVFVSEGEYVFRAGDAADSFFIIQAGQVELLRRGDARERLALLDAGDLIGEDSAFGGQLRACDARAITRVSLLSVDAATFIDVVRVRPDLAARVISLTALRLLQARAACVAMARPVVQPAVPVAAAVPAARGPASPPAAPRFVHAESGSQFPLAEDGETVVGRADPRTRFQPAIELSSVDSHRSLSRRHARVARKADGFVIVEEPRVANGTFVNGKRLSAGAAVAINDGDEVCFGLIKTVFRTT